MPRTGDASRIGLPSLALRRVRRLRIRALDSLARSVRSHPRSIL